MLNYFSLEPHLKGNLSAYILCLLLLLIFFKFTLVKKKAKSSYVSYADTLPYHQWIPFVKLPLLDGLIFWYKFRKDGVTIAEKVAGKHRPDVTLSLGFRRTIGVSNPDTIQKILSSTTPAHANKPRFLYTHLLTRFLKDGLLAANLNTWSKHRNVLATAFKYKSLITYCKFINNEAKTLAQSACCAAEKVEGNVINNQTMNHLIDHHAVRIVTHLIMGTEIFSFSDEQRISFQASFKRMKALTVERFQRPELLIPPIWWLHPNRKHMELETNNLLKMLHQITDSFRISTSVKKSERGGENNFNSSPTSTCLNSSKNVLELETIDEQLGNKPFQCLVEVMIKAGFSNKEICDEVATFLVAGHETVKVALHMLLFHLAGNQIHQKICQTEVDELFDSKSGVDFDLEDFSNSKLKYLEMCILESMRLTPTVPFFLRELHEPLQMDDSSVIPAGQLVAVNVWALHRNPEIYPNPEKFDPNRFLPETVKQRHLYSFIPFSMGVRNCIGWKVALLEIKAVTAWILRHFEMHTTDGPNDVKLLFDVTLKPERPYNVTYKQRRIKDSN